MPIVWIRQKVGLVPNGFRQAILLSEGERFSLVCPATDNELARGITQGFLDWLVTREHLFYAPPTRGEQNA